MILKGLSITVNYPDDECQADVPECITPLALGALIHKLCEVEPEMTSFVIVASVDRNA